MPQLSATYLTIDDVNATVDANNENILADRYNVEFLGDGSCLIYARDGIDVGTHDENVDDVTSSIHLGVCAHNDCDDDVFIACPTCLNFLCFDHKDSSCECHTSNIPENDTHASLLAGSHVIIVDAATGAELKVPVINSDKFETSNQNDIHDEDNGDVVNTGDDSLSNNVTGSPYETSANDDALHSRKRVRHKMSHPSHGDATLKKAVT